MSVSLEVTLLRKNPESTIEWPLRAVRVPPSTFRDYMKRLMDSHGVSGDVEIRVPKGGEFRARKCVLSARCGYFRTMFDSKMKEAIAGGEKELCKVEIEDFTVNCFGLFLEYVHTDDLPPIVNPVNPAAPGVKLALELHRLADKYDMPHLRGLVEREIASLLSELNLCNVLARADRMGLPGLPIRDMCVRFAVEQVGIGAIVRAGKDYDGLSEETVRFVLSSISHDSDARKEAERERVDLSKRKRDRPVDPLENEMDQRKRKCMNPNDEEESGAIFV